MTATRSSADDLPKKLLLIGSAHDNHPLGEHEFMPGVQILARCLAPVKQLAITQIEAGADWPEGPQLLSQADGAVLYLAQGARWIESDSKRHDALAQLASRKGGFVALHAALMTTDAKDVAGFLKLLGACHGGPDRKLRFLETQLRPSDAKHPIATGLRPLTIKDEFYYQLKRIQPDTDLTPVLEAKIDERWEPVAWSWQRPDGGRSFGFTGMHYHANWDNAGYRRLVAQGVLWTLGVPIPEGGLDVDLTIDRGKHSP